MDMDAVLTNQHPGPELSLYTFSPIEIIHDIIHQREINTRFCLACYVFVQSFIDLRVLQYAIGFHTGHYSIVSTIILLAAPMGRNQNMSEMEYNGGTRETGF